MRAAFATQQQSRADVSETRLPRERPVARDSLPRCSPCTRTAVTIRPCMTNAEITRASTGLAAASQPRGRDAVGEQEREAEHEAENEMAARRGHGVAAYGEERNSRLVVDNGP